MKEEIEIDTWTVMGTARHLQQYSCISVTGTRQYVDQLIKKVFEQYDIESIISEERSSKNGWLLMRKQ